MKMFVFALAALVGSASASFAAAPDCTKFNMQLGYNNMDAIRDVLAGKLTGSTRMFSDRCEKTGQVLELVLTTDPVDGAGKRKAQGRVKMDLVQGGLAFGALTDDMAKQQGLANANDLRAFLGTIYGKDAQGQPVDLAKQSWTHLKFSVVR